MLPTPDKMSPPDNSMQSSAVNMTSHKSSTSDLENLLFNNSLRLWRTGEDEELYLPDKDWHVDVSVLLCVEFGVQFANTQYNVHNLYSVQPLLQLSFLSKRGVICIEQRCRCGHVVRLHSI